MTITGSGGDITVCLAAFLLRRVVEEGRGGVRTMSGRHLAAMTMHIAEGAAEGGVRRKGRKFVY